jgi:DNA-binding transcriptional MerR regulator
MNDVSAFSAEQMMALTGLSARQLAYWDRLGFFRPQYSERLENDRAVRLYSFRDLVGLRVLALLRNRHHVPLQQLRKVHALLVGKSESPWSAITFYVLGRSVYFDDPDTGLRMSGTARGQRVLEVSMARVENDMRAAANRLRERTPDEVGTVRQYRAVMSHAPVLAGTRVPTSAIWNFHKAGYDTSAILAEYPSLTSEDVEVALADERRRRQRAG